MTRTDEGNDESNRGAAGMLRITPRALRLIFLSTTAFLAAASACASQLEWIGGTDNLWHTPTNWAPIEAPGQEPIQRAPQEGDAVSILDTTHGTTVRLDADSAMIESLVLGNGFELNMDNNVLEVAGPTTLAGSGTTLAVLPRVWESDHLPAFLTRQLQIGDGSAVQLHDAVLHVREQARIDPGGELGGYGNYVFGEDRTPAGTVALINEGTLGTVHTDLPFRYGGVWLSARGGAVLDLDGQSELGTIDLDRTERVSLSAYVPLTDPYNGPLSIRPGDSFYSQSDVGPFAFEDVAISIDGGPIGGDILIDGESTVTIGSEGTGIDGSFQMLGGTFQSFGPIVLETSDGASYAGLGRKEFGPNSKFFLEDGTSLTLPGFNFTTGVDVRSMEIDLDGDNGDVEITIGLWSGLAIEAPAIDNDPSSPGFDGTIHLDGSGLTMNIEGGWELDGRLELETNSHRGSGQVFGTPITVDGGEEGEGIFVGVLGADSPHPTTIHADVTLTKKGRIGVLQYGLLSIEGALWLDGTLEYTINPAYNEPPPIGAVETLIIAEGGISGRFTTHDLFPLPLGRAWLVQYDSNRVGIRVVEAIDGEYNGNGIVEQADLDLVLLNWGQAAAPPPDGWVNELPGGFIDQEELDRVLLGWGDAAVFPSSQGAQGVPEPASMATLAACLIGVILCKLGVVRVLIFIWAQRLSIAIQWPLRPLGCTGPVRRVPVWPEPRRPTVTLRRGQRSHGQR
jgi:hypothetical protein